MARKPAAQRRSFAARERNHRERSRLLRAALTEAHSFVKCLGVIMPMGGADVDVEVLHSTIAKLEAIRLKLLTLRGTT